MKVKQKPCKAINKAKGFESCGELAFKRTYGLCDGCYRDWLLNSTEGQQKVLKTSLKAKKDGWNKRKSTAKESLKTKKDYEKELQAVFNTFIRLRDKGKPCISCNRPITAKYDAGHFFPVGSYKNLRFNEDNCHAQCVHCNQHKHGNLNEYTVNLPTRIGQQPFDKLIKDRLIEKHYSIPELIELKVIYKDKIKTI